MSNPSPSHTVWIIDDDQSIRRILHIALERAGYTVKCLANADNAIEALKLTDPPDVIFCDIRMPGTDGLSFLDHLQSHDANLPVIIMTAHSDLNATVNAYSHGAYDYLPKPFDLNNAIEMAQSAIESRQSNVTSTLSSPELSAKIIGDSPAMQNVYRIIGRLHNSSVNVLITGETGTGKELVAQALHQNSPRKNQPYIAINTAAIPRDLLESELFGHEKGAFTGATALRKGRFEQANGGTLFLDEIGDMPLDLQTRLLRVLAEGEFYRVGGQQPITVDVRVVAATHQDLHHLSQQGSFREDLYHRLNVIRLVLPPLRERAQDIDTLLQHFIKRVSTEIQEEPKALSDETLALLQTYDWPGNVRQLENVVRSLLIMTSGNIITPHDLPSTLLPGLNIDDHLASDDDTALSNDQTHNSTHPTKHTSTALDTTDNKIATSANLTAGIANDTFNDETWAEFSRQWIRTKIQHDEYDIATQSVKLLERCLIEIVLEETDGHRQAAAKRLGWGRNTLTRKINELFDESP